MSFEVTEGDRIGLIGLNGSGKSTLLKVLSGHLRPSSGKVILERSVLSLSHFDSLLHPDLTGAENIRMQLKILGVKPADMEDSFQEVVAFSELSEFISHPVKTYSSGMMLRLSFSIFKAVKPEILLLDEVFSAGDILFRKKADALLREHLDAAASVIIASHELTEIARYCNRCLVLEKGKLVFDGSVDQALERYIDKNSPTNEITHNNDALELLKASTDSKQFRVSENIEFQVCYTKKTDDILDLVIYIRNKFGYAITDCEIYRSDHQRNSEPKGEYRISATVPKHLLNVGKYSVDLSFGNGIRDVLVVESAFRFEVIPDDWEKDRLWNQNPIVPVRPHLKWKKHRVT